MADGPTIELILARNLITALTTPAFVVDMTGVMTFFNEAAGRLIGRRFSESGRLTRDQWNEIGPLDGDGRPQPSGRLPLTVALREGRPAVGRFRIRTDEDRLIEVQANAVPLCGAQGLCGALVTFLPLEESGGRGEPDPAHSRSLRRPTVPDAER